MTTTDHDATARAIMADLLGLPDTSPMVTAAALRILPRVMHTPTETLRAELIAEATARVMARTNLAWSMGTDEADAA